MRLINADELIKTLQEREDAPPEWDGAIFKDAFSIAIMDIIAQPTIEAEPVKHGEWIGTEYDGYADGYPVFTAFMCSECKIEFLDDSAFEWHYCPNCGAKMAVREE